MELSTLGLTLRVAVVATAINFPVALVVSWLVVKRRVELQRNICAEVVVESSRSALPVHLPQPAMQHGRLSRTRCSRARAPAFESNPSLVAGVAEPHRTHR